MKPYPLLSFSLRCLMLAGTVSPAFAGEPSEGPDTQVESAALEDGEAWSWKDLWDLPVLYRNPVNPYIQEVALTGRYQYQYAAVDSDQGDWDRGETRRWRAGASIKFLQDFELAGEININDDFEPFYSSIEELHVTWRPSDLFHLQIGKQKAPFTYEWSVSSRRILTFERSIADEILVPNKSTGVSMRGSHENWSYLLGAYFAGRDAEFGSTDRGEFYLASVGYDFSEAVACLDSAKWRLDWLVNRSDPQGDEDRPYDGGLATSMALTKGDFGLVSDLIFFWGDSPNALRLVLLGNYDITEKLQLVCRYNGGFSHDDGLRVQSRYERQVDLTDGGRGDEYHAVYLGLNYYLNDHKLKLMAGVEYANMNDKEGDGGDFDGFTGFAGIRLYY
ncbi:MAG TPA: porin [Verrucomicrobiales bacterium]|nr:porin [Verrucomicrobiales bacterium]